MGSCKMFLEELGLIKEDIVKAVHQFFISLVMPEGINDTTIVLVPKVKRILNPSKTSDQLVYVMSSIKSLEVPGESTKTTLGWYILTRLECLYSRKVNL